MTRSRPHILSLLQRRPERAWQGTTERLWTRLSDIAGEAARAVNFPQSPVALGRAPRRIEPALAVRGVTMERERVTAGTRITLRMSGGATGAHVGCTRNLQAELP